MSDAPERIWICPNISIEPYYYTYKHDEIISIPSNGLIEYIRKDIVNQEGYEIAEKIRADIDKQRQELVKPIVGVLHKLGESPTNEELIEAIHETIKLAEGKY